MIANSKIKSEKLSNMRTQKVDFSLNKNVRTAEISEQNSYLKQNKAGLVRLCKCSNCSELYMTINNSQCHRQKLRLSMNQTYNSSTYLSGILI